MQPLWKEKKLKPVVADRFLKRTRVRFGSFLFNVYRVAFNSVTDGVKVWEHSLLLDAFTTFYRYNRTSGIY